ncbi:serine/threonine-protein kinase [Streptomyces sp. DSM 44917]|uniref:non-specific serine/threonine protein kinase n=1 Tax=Streptomyces boetiae TaxID=3075541 RepID=A0ABU2L6K0_9ACTN|nr:serine/threonine-protein kinase [Streptomyces sp. DSM 44917]MDT0307186.1 serine/threonine-protein kinase [Streptomyces sp. DSM 44917]
MAPDGGGPVARFRKLERLHGGGQGTVWRAEEIETGDQVAIKFLKDASERRRFEREARYQSSLRHSGIMPIIAMGLKQEKPFYVMPIAAGSLEDRLELGPLDEEHATSIIIDVLHALEYAHNQGVLHRDLKPANLLLLDNRWVISDFGLCRQVQSDSTTITRVNSAVGSAAYMAPEQFDNAHTATATADIYAVGQILYHCLTGEIPFPRPRIRRLEAKYRYFISRCVAEEPDQRFQSVAEVRRELELLTASGSEVAPPTARANALKAQALDGDATATAALLRLLLDSSEDEVFFKDFIPSLPQELLREMIEGDPIAFDHMVRSFDAYADGGHPFDYTDQIASFFFNVLQVADNASLPLRHLSLRRILIVGSTHNRFYVGEVFARAVAGLKSPEDIFYAASLLRSDTFAAHFVKPYLKRFSLPGPIAQALP